MCKVKKEGILPVIFIMGRIPSFLMDINVQKVSVNMCCRRGVFSDSFFFMALTVGIILVVSASLIYSLVVFFEVVMRYIDVFRLKFTEFVQSVGCYEI